MAPLTGFFGTNSSGKTAILQFLLMLKQTVESNDQSQVLNFGNEHTYVDLGTVETFVYKHQLPSIISFSLAWQPGCHQNDVLKLPVARPIESPSRITESLEPKYSDFQPDWLRFDAHIKFVSQEVIVEALHTAIQRPINPLTMLV